MLKVSASAANGAWRLAASAPPRPSRSAFSMAMIAAALVFAGGGTLWLSDGEAREIRALPAAQRQGLYRRTIENLKTICDPAPGRSVREFCRDQATFALQFPECDDECHRTARRHLSLPRR